MRFTLLTQVALLTLSVAIILLFIKPALSQIKSIQDDLLVYSDAVAKAEEYNKRLQELLSIHDSFSQNDLAKIERFIPSTIDTIAIMHEIENIFASKNVGVVSLIAKPQELPIAEALVEGEVPPENQAPALASQDFEVKFTGDYDTLKEILGVLESNNRLLEVVDMHYGEKKDELSSEVIEQDSQTGEQFFIINLRAYALQAPSTESTTL